MHSLHQTLIESPQLIKLVSKADANSPETAIT
jgi:hypothetical protein